MRPYVQYMTGYAGSQDYEGTSQSPQKTPHQSTYPTEKQDSVPLVADSYPFVANSVWVFCAQNSQREGRSLVFQWDVWIGVGSSAETARSLRNPETQRTPSDVGVCHVKGNDRNNSPVKVIQSLENKLNLGTFAKCYREMFSYTI